MADLPVIRVGGVPEHFNEPWHHAIEMKAFEENGVKVEWVMIPNGTGAMITALKEGEVDVIVALTEGLVSEIVKGANLRLISTYVSSPLRWGVICGKDAPYQNISDLKDQVFGISRYTSGSHLMVCVTATERGWHPASLKFNVQGNFQNLRDGVNSGQSAAFLWNYSTTKPFVDSGEVKFVGDVTTPWSCFMMASTTDILAAKGDAISKMLPVIRKSCEEFHADDEKTIKMISSKYHINEDDCREWYKKLSITASSEISEASLNRAVSALYNAKVTDVKEVDPKTLIDPKFAALTRDIESIKLYQKPELVKFLHNNLIANGLAAGSVKYTDLLPFDQHHYFGVDAVDHYAKAANITKNSSIINIGSGMGGPARYLAGKYGADVLAIELQDTLHRPASELTERSGLQDKVHHLCGNILQVGRHLSKNNYDSITSWLTILHIYDRPSLFSICYDLLKPGGTFCAVDFFKLNNFTEKELAILEKDIFARAIPDLTTYKNQLKLAGFELVLVEDVTEAHKSFTSERVKSWHENEQALKGVHRKNTYERLLDFYTKAQDLYLGGNLGGIRFVVRKPSA